jgi:hypothetical protein
LLIEVDDKHFSQSHSKIVKIDGKSKIDDNDELDHTSNEKKDNDMKNDDCSISLTDDFLSWKCVMEDMELQDIPLNDFHSESQQNGKRIAEQTYIPLFQVSCYLFYRYSHNVLIILFSAKQQKHTTQGHLI